MRASQFKDGNSFESSFLNFANMASVPSELAENVSHRYRFIVGRLRFDAIEYGVLCGL